MTEAFVYVKYGIYSSVVAGRFIGQILSFNYFYYELSVIHNGATPSSFQRFFAHVQDTDFAHHCNNK
jgi:hypothetical protein